MKWAVSSLPSWRKTRMFWSEVLPAQKNIRYKAPRLVLFNGVTRSALRHRAIGDGTILLSRRSARLSRHVVLQRHEVQARRRRRFRLCLCDRPRDRASHRKSARHSCPRFSRPSRTPRSSRPMPCRCGVELMADCLAGVWAANANQKWKILEQGDVEEAMATAAAIGDDRLQRSSRGYAVPDSFTHGSSAPAPAMVYDRPEIGPGRQLQHIRPLKRKKAGDGRSGLSIIPLPAGSLLQHALQQFDFLADTVILRRDQFDLAHGMEHGGVIAPAKPPSDLRVANAASMSWPDTWRSDAGARHWLCGARTEYRRG